MKLTLRLICCFVFVLTGTILQAQEAGIKGTVIEEKTGQPLPGATVIIKSLKKSKVTDPEGGFLFAKMTAGQYELEVVATGYNTKQVSEIVVPENEVISVTVSLEEKSNKLEEVVVTNTRAKQESVKGLLTMQKNSATVQDGISAETIKRTPDKNTSDVLKRISGASIQDNRFVIVRGLNDRYNYALINNSTLPSSESDRKAFSFDIFPSNMLDNLVITKTASPDLPGEFAGGMIQITTKTVPDKDFQSITVGAGYNTTTTFKEQTTYKGGRTDWLGFDDGTRAFPSTVPPTSVFYPPSSSSEPPLDTQQKGDIAKSFQYDWGLNKTHFLPNLNMQYSLGRHYEIGEKVFGMLWSATYNKTNTFNVMKTYDYEDASVVKSKYSDNQYNEQVLAGLLGNFSLKFNQNNNLSFKNIFSINSTDLVSVRTGQTDVNDTRTLNSDARWFTSNMIYSGQLNGDHYFSKPKIKLNWTGFYSNIDRSIPNLRRNLYTTADPNSTDPLQNTPVASIPQATAGPEYGGNMFWSENKESIAGGRFDLTKKFSLGEESENEFKFGGFTQYRDRNFSARQLQYTQTPPNVTFADSLLTLPNSQIFVKQNMGQISPDKYGFLLNDATKFTDSYQATSGLNAGYLMLDNRYKKLRLVWGVRVESYKQTLDARLKETEYLHLNNKQTDILPSFNLIYSITKKANLRLSYSKTLNRPEFRELAPFVFYDFVTQYLTQGNDSLKIAKIRNYDLRYEIYPGKGQLFSVSYFRKKFDNPIETQLLANNTITYKNADSATDSGIEIEFRTLLSSIFGSARVLDDLTLSSNLALINSKVDVSSFKQANTDSSRPLQGQSPYVVNAGLLYVNKESGWGASANFNRVGNRISIVGKEGVPDIWEKARSFLDMQVSKLFHKNKMELKLNMQNILAQDRIFYMNNNPAPSSKYVVDYSNPLVKVGNLLFTGDESNKNGYDPKTDDVKWLTKFGRTFTLSFTYNF